jgi:hypothetical protein
VAELEDAAAGGGLGADALGVDGHVGRARRGPEQGQAGGQDRQGPGERRQHRRDGERGHHDGGCTWAAPVGEPARWPHRGQRATPDQHEREPEAGVVDPGRCLHRGQDGTPGAPEEPERRVPGQRPGPGRSVA